MTAFNPRSKDVQAEIARAVELLDEMGPDPHADRHRAEMDNPARRTPTTDEVFAWLMRQKGKAA